MHTIVCRIYTIVCPFCVFFGTLKILCVEITNPRYLPVQSKLSEHASGVDHAEPGVAVEVCECAHPG